MKPKRGAGLFARAPKGEPVYFSMLCSDFSSRRRLICHVVSARHPARDVRGRSPTSLTRCCRRSAGRWPRASLHTPGHILRQINAGNLVCQAAFAVPARKGIAASFRHILRQVNEGVVAAADGRKLIPAVRFKGQRVIDGRVVARRRCTSSGRRRWYLQRQTVSVVTFVPPLFSVYQPSKLCLLREALGSELSF